MTLEIIPADQGKALGRFIGLPARVYAGQAGFVSPLRMDRRGLFDPAKATFFREGRARYFLARRDGRDVGRISAQIGAVAPRGAQPGHGQFGALDAADDADAIAALIAAAEGWLAAQGCTGVFGPCTLSMNEEPGLMGAGHDQPPMTMTPWHAPYLEGHLLRAGYRPVKDLHSWRLDNSADVLARGEALTKRSAANLGLSVRNLDLGNMGRELATMCEVYNDAWSGNWGFVPLDPRDLVGIEKELKPFLHPDVGIFVERRGKPVAVMLILPNLFDITGDLGMDPSLLGWVKLGLRSLRPRFTSGRIILMGISGAMRGSVGGAAIAMTLVEELIKRHSTRDWSHIEAGWVLEDNDALVRLLEYGGFARTKTFRLFEKSFSQTHAPKGESR